MRSDGVSVRQSANKDFTTGVDAKSLRRSALISDDDSTIAGGRLHDVASECRSALGERSHHGEDERFLCEAMSHFYVPSERTDRLSGRVG